jgi:hypothetical protein
MHILLRLRERKTQRPMSQLWWEFCAPSHPACFKAREVSTFDQANFQSARLWSSRVSAPINRKILAFDKAVPSKLFKHCNILRRTSWTGEQADNAIGPPSLLRGSYWRPRCRCTAQSTEKLAPPHLRPMSQEQAS